jgi:hypothetical protein
MQQEKLITKQALEIEELKEKVNDYNESVKLIRGLLFSVGAPLNDNILGYSKEQRKIFHDIANILETLRND